ncbi:MAG TPA: hypothetical protein VEP68_00485, partial [Anaeromyxobacteraceae bacterium]|nr:hypothetical protein [Anaeromyxobacteraceae bacterium]
MPPPPLPQDARPRPRPHALLAAAAGLAVLLALGGLGASGILGRWLRPVDPALLAQARAAVEARAASQARAVARPPAPTLRLSAATRRLAANQTVGQALLAMGLGAEELQAVL